MTNIIDTFGQATEVPTSNGQLESALTPETDDQWFAVKALIEGRCARPIDPSMHGNVEYLQAYLKGATATIDARLVLPSRLVEQEAAILLEFAELAASTVRRLHTLDEHLAKVGEW